MLAFNAAQKTSVIAYAVLPKDNFDLLVVEVYSMRYVAEIYVESFGVARHCVHRNGLQRLANTLSLSINTE